MTFNVRARQVLGEHLPSGRGLPNALRLWEVSRWEDRRARPPDADRETLGLLSSLVPPSGFGPWAGRQLEALGDCLAWPLSACRHLRRCGLTYKEAPGTGTKGKVGRMGSPLALLSLRPT